MPARPSNVETAPSCITPAPDNSGTSSCSASTRAGEPLVLERLAHPPGVRDRHAVVGEARCSLGRQLHHLRELRPGETARDRSEEADRHERLAGGALLQSDAGPAPRRPPGRCSASRARSRTLRPQPRGFPIPDPPRPRGPACAGARAGRRTRERRAGPRRRPPRLPAADRSSPERRPRRRGRRETSRSAGPFRSARGSSSHAERKRVSAGAAAREQSVTRGKRGVFGAEFKPAAPPSARARRPVRRSGRVRRAGRRGSPSGPRARSRPGSRSAPAASP